MSRFTEQIGVAYPPGNKPIFEEWFSENYKGCNTDRELIPFFPTSYWVNNDYGNNAQSKLELQNYIDSLDIRKKWFCICQYDDGVMVDWKGLDVLEFNMSKKVGIEIPLICQPHPYKFNTEKKYFASFVGGRTHPIRNELEKFKDLEDWYISFDPHSIEDYCRILHESVFALCPRGYGANSFRTTESLQYRTTPIYISDYFIGVFDADFNEFGLKVDSNDIGRLPKILDSNCLDLMDKQTDIKHYYNEYYSYEGCFKNIIKSLELEYTKRKV